jgi:hypothetical protein
MPPLARLRGSEVAAIVLKRRPRFRLRSKHIFKCASHHTDDCVSITIEPHWATDDRMITAKMSAP